MTGTTVSPHPESSGDSEEASPTAKIDSFADLTQHEIRALKTKYNLADAHTHQRQSPSQEKIIEQLPSLWYQAEEDQQSYFESRLIDAFFLLHRQPTARLLGRTMLSYSASVSTIVAAMYLKQRNMSVALIEPCFDNLTDLMRNMGVPLTPLPEELLRDTGRIRQRLDAEIDADAIYLVDPNNPTGFSLLSDGRAGFEAVIEHCVEHHRLLMIDLCFASFALCDGTGRIDIYEMLESSGVNYIALEDTGKTWPIQDAKCAMLTTSSDIYADVYNIHTSVLLNVSPFVLNLVGSYIEDSIDDGFASVGDLLVRNAQAAREALDGTILEYQHPKVNTSVSWYRILPPELTATTLHQILLDQDVYVLPGTYFFWHEPERGERFIRIALAREPRVFAAAVARVREVLRRYGR